MISRGLSPEKVSPNVCDCESSGCCTWWRLLKMEREGQEMEESMKESETQRVRGKLKLGRENETRDRRARERKLMKDAFTSAGN
ncbi:uncharacterized protein G2W53_013883 [Senna tora]|uniref:Uncharacterized protein n=1 Tax=Senna tora TaxID=362788 RepID=A0A834U2U0_9FABA|nr:uncharacterized protein G2W53_013883 [Senna tora]